MNILIVEDEKRVAFQLKKMVAELLPTPKLSIVIQFELDEAIPYLKMHQTDLVLLDLNLNGEDGFEILKAFTAESFQTIITSAYKDKAIDAFEYGALDFVPKPFKKERLKIALSRWQKGNKTDHPAKYLVIKKVTRNLIIEVDKVIFIKAAGHHTALHLDNGQLEPHHKSLDQLLQLLPSHFERIHKSYVINRKAITELVIHPGNKYFFFTQGGFKVPIGRTFYKNLKKRFL